MPLAKVLSCAVVGLDGELVEVEVDVASGQVGLHLVGLPGAAVQEAKERVRSAIKNSGFQFPLRRITVSLAPADLRKEGPAYATGGDRRGTIPGASLCPRSILEKTPVASCQSGGSARNTFKVTGSALVGCPLVGKPVAFGTKLALLGSQTIKRLVMCLFLRLEWGMKSTHQE